MRNIIVGTAGHIDHGKTALVRALTGIDTDRLAEEKRRGISIELGFANMSLGPDLEVGFVDVPGHERFVKNMLAGAGGINIVLLVISADESIKPQTREHFDICRLLGISKGIVVLTKADLVEKDILDLVRLEVEEFLTGSFLEGAPMVAVSSVTGGGLDELRGYLRETALKVPARDSSRHFRLPLDRVFSMKGFGTVVTGTLVSGSVRREDEVEAHPSGRRLRVRGIQVHSHPVETALAGQRTAINVSGAEPSDLARGMVLTHPGLFRPVREIDCRLRLLPSAKPIKHRAPVHFHAGTAEIEAMVRLLDGASTLEPGGVSLVRIALREPALILPGDRFIIRMFSPVVTIGGGTVIDIDAPSFRPREKMLYRLELLESGVPADRVLLLVRESKYGLGIPELVARTGLLAAEIDRATGSPHLLRLGEPMPWIIERERVDALTRKLQAVIGSFHKANPLLPGVSKEEVRSKEMPDAPPFLLDALIARSDGIVSEGELLRLASHRLVLQEDEERAIAAIEKVFSEAGLTVPPVQEALAKSGVDLRRARTLLQILLRQKKLVKVSDDLVFHETAMRGLLDTLARHKGERFTVTTFKDRTGLSRKYAIPLLEYLDRERITRRLGDERLVL